MYWVIYQFTVWNIMFFWQLVTEGSGNVLEQYGRFVSSQYPMLLCVVVLIPFFAWDALRFSLRVAGPIYRIRATIKALEEGRTLKPVKLRQGDYLQDVIDELNALIVFMDERSFRTDESAPTKSHAQLNIDSASTVIMDSSHNLESLAESVK